MIPKATPELVQMIFHKLRREIRPTLLEEDLLQAGTEAYLKAKITHDPSKNASFKTYASIKIRYAMIDELRRNMYFPRAMSYPTSLLQSCDPVTPYENQDDFSIDEDRELSSLLDSVAAGFPLNASKDPAEITLEEDLWRTILSLKLTDRQQQIFAVLLSEEGTLRQLAKEWNITDARISQLRSNLIRYLRLRLT